MDLPRKFSAFREIDNWVLGRYTDTVWSEKMGEWMFCITKIYKTFGWERGFPKSVCP